jgi:Arc/MetJ-type ribon-helix-helix transcriptional regulator
MKRTTIRLPEDLLKRVRRKAVTEGRTLSALIEDGLRLLLSSTRAPGKTERILPHVSEATGGLLPGIDISNSAALQEMDDLEYVERMKRGFK